MRSVIAGAAGVALLIGVPAQADVYRCVENGKVVYYDAPCRADAGTVRDEILRKEEQRRSAKAAQEQRARPRLTELDDAPRNSAATDKQSGQLDTTPARARSGLHSEEEICSALMRGPVVVSNNGRDGSVRQVVAYLSKSLRDPDSFAAIEWGRVERNCDGYSVRVKYRARNGFGGMSIETKDFQLGHDGAVIGVAAQ